MNSEAVPAALAPLGVTTSTYTTPAIAVGGTVAVIWVAESTENDAGDPPNRTCDAPLKCWPVMTTDEPPDVSPDVGWRLVVMGGGPLGDVEVQAVSAPPPAQSRTAPRIQMNGVCRGWLPRDRRSA